MLGTSPAYYQLFYICTMSIIVLVYYMKIKSMNVYELLYTQKSMNFMLFYSLLFIVIYGFRPAIYGFGDTASYAYTYNQLRDGAVVGIESGDMLFNQFMLVCSQLFPVKYFFFLIEILYIVPVVIACLRLSEKNAPILLLFVFGALSFYSYSINGIRNGMACSFVILALTYIRGGWLYKIICAALCFAAYGFHHSSLLPVLCMVSAYLLPKPKLMLAVWMLSIFASLIVGNAAADLFANLGFDDRMANYLNNAKDEAYLFSHIGFRWDFLLYSFMPIWLGWYVIFKRKVYDKTYILLLGTYILANAFWILVIRSSFSNRFAYLSWFMYPLVLGYPLLKFPVWKTKHTLKVALVFLMQFAFTFVSWITE